MALLSPSDHLQISDAFRQAMDGGPVVFTGSPVSGALYATRPAMPHLSTGQIVDELVRLGEVVEMCVHISVMDGEIAFFLH